MMKVVNNKKTEQACQHKYVKSLDIDKKLHLIECVVHKRGMFFKEISAKEALVKKGNFMVYEGKYFEYHCELTQYLAFVN